RRCTLMARRTTPLAIAPPIAPGARISSTSARLPSIQTPSRADARASKSVPAGIGAEYRGLGRAQAYRSDVHWVSVAVHAVSRQLSSAPFKKNKAILRPGLTVR